MMVTKPPKKNVDAYLYMLISIAYEHMERKRYNFPTHRTQISERIIPFAYRQTTMSEKTIAIHILQRFASIHAHSRIENVRIDSWNHLNITKICKCCANMAYCCVASSVRKMYVAMRIWEYWILWAFIRLLHSHHSKCVLCGKMLVKVCANCEDKYFMLIFTHVQRAKKTYRIHNGAFARFTLISYAED